MRRREFLQTATAAGVAAAAPLRARAAEPRFAATDDGFRLDGKPLVIRSGEMHYPRVPRPYWRDRFRKMRALGLNTVCTYVFWNLHEPRPGHFDFSDNLDVADYLKQAHEEGLWAIVRPGPYICTEWDFGGFPAWLLAGDMKVRSADPAFLGASGRYLTRLGAELAPLRIERGGPIILTQVENEYGSFGADHAYMAAIRDQIKSAGLGGVLYTSDGPSPKLLSSGTLPDLPCVINFGDGDPPARQFAQLAQFRSTGPRMCGEYWVGWFDHWGETHHTTAPEKSASGLEWMLANNVSCNLYMFHGGTSFGFMSGANYGRYYQPDTSNYDYDSPLDEAGRPTPKFEALRAVIYQSPLARGETRPPMPEPLPQIEIPRFRFTQSAGFEPLLGKPVESEHPLTMEKLGQAYGYILYRTNVSAAPAAQLDVTEARDYAIISQGGRRLGVLDRRRGQTSIEAALESGPPLEILVENMGRVNYGPHLLDDRKGISAQVAFAGQEITGWKMYSLPLDNLSKLKFSTATPTGPAFYRAEIDLATTGDTFLDLRGWGKGCVWVNGRNLGRYWEIGPQQSLFLPGCWLKRGANEVIVLDLEPGRPRTAAGVQAPIYGKSEAAG